MVPIVGTEVSGTFGGSFALATATGSRSVGRPNHAWEAAAPCKSWIEQVLVPKKSLVRPTSLVYRGIAVSLC